MDIYESQPVVKSFMNIISETIIDSILLPSFGMPRVQANQQLDEFGDVFQFLDGLKDGTVAITGTDSKLFLCDGNVSATLDVWWFNWQPYTVDVGTKFDTVNWPTTMDALSENTGKMFRWPFFTLWSCYWATNDLIYRYDSLKVPLLLQERAEDG